MFCALGAPKRPSEGASKSRSGRPKLDECFRISMTQRFPRPSVLAILLITVLRVPPTENRRSGGLREACRGQHREHTKSQIPIVICKIFGSTFDHCFARSPTEKRRSECMWKAHRSQHREHPQSQIRVVICKIEGFTEPKI